MSAAAAHLTGAMGRLAAYVRRRLREPADTEDVVQETIMRVIEQDRKRVIDQPLAYAFRVADSVIHARARGRIHADLDEHADLMCELPLADEILDYRQRMARFETALGQLTPQRRAVFMKRHLEGKSRQEIAEETGLGLEAVKKHLVRAMVELAQVVEGNAGTTAAEKNKNG
ncbi:sigma-70 family RNA polymerase sigma factor [Sphingobium sp. CR2-8]|uniref:RNA polymerase sigma factor n=1 Tax=Sphingobium sp. CR2-8 TaxID=1306534 RepID=UPI002DBACAA0|nr:sigma-70 family RNA polymerase sigma factor [Sphingobium sp. CR2-8]MEC3909418.1 sigma-70 family RNA polymerase sigma factor [Sphingobium sp. CR2-8]